MAKPVRVGVIGLGSMGANHARVLAELPDAELVAVADPDAARLREHASGATIYEDFQELLNDERLDAVTIAVPTRLHLGVALACIGRGLPLLVEKPLAADLDECLQLKDAAEAAGAPLMVGHIERFHPVVVAARRWLQEGQGGEIYEARLQRVGPFFERVRDVGVVHDLATHDVDILRVLFGCEIERVSAEVVAGVRTPFEDALSAVMRLSNGVTATLEVNWLSPAKVRGFRMLAERGQLEGDFLPQALIFSFDEPGAGKESCTTIPVQRGEPLRAELEAFLRVARGEEPPPVTAQDAIEAMRVVEALIESARRGRAMSVAAGSAT